MFSPSTSRNVSAFAEAMAPERTGVLQDGRMPAPPAVRLPLLDLRALEALVRNDLAAASAAAGVALPAWFPEDEWLWTLRLGQAIGEPGHAPWLTRVVVPA